MWAEKHHSSPINIQLLRKGAKQFLRMEVKLLGAALSPFVVRVRVALNLKGVQYEFVEENTQNKSQLLLQSNPVHKKIPVLIHNGNPICESMIIVEYINETWSSTGIDLMPNDPYHRAIARFWAAFVDDKIMACVRGIFGAQGEELKKAVEESVGNLMLLEEALRTTCKPFFGGDNIGFVDIALGSLSSMILVLQQITNVKLVETEKMPLLSSWMKRFRASDGVKEVLPDMQKLLEFAAARRSGLTSVARNTTK